MFGTLTPLPGETHQELYQRTGIDLDNRRETINNHFAQTNIEHELFISYAKKLPGFKEIPLEDQIKLLKGNIFLLKNASAKLKNL